MTEMQNLSALNYSYSECGVVPDIARIKVCDMQDMQMYTLNT